uniref:Putative secreted protein n=1 Tax=Anopheles triannulatus TaxID=58253 RepID=A0A2M4B7L3_9DIPT
MCGGGVWRLFPQSPALLILVCAAVPDCKCSNTLEARNVVDYLYGNFANASAPSSRVTNVWPNGAFPNNFGMGNSFPRSFDGLSPLA